MHCFFFLFLYTSFFRISIAEIVALNGFLKNRQLQLLLGARNTAQLISAFLFSLLLVSLSQCLGYCNRSSSA